MTPEDVIAKLQRMEYGKSFMRLHKVKYERLESDIPKDEIGIVKSYKSGASMKVICDDYGISHFKMYSVLRKNGVPLRRK